VAEQSQHPIATTVDQDSADTRSVQSLVSNTLTIAAPDDPGNATVNAVEPPAATQQDASLPPATAPELNVQSSP
jgi:hypothetical protein